MTNLVSDTERGLYKKFNVERTDGSSQPGGKHAACEYFVLDLAHDPFAVPALAAYAEACQNTYPLLATDLRQQFDSTVVPTSPELEAILAVAQDVIGHIRRDSSYPWQPDYKAIRAAQHAASITQFHNLAVESLRQAKKLDAAWEVLKRCNAFAEEIERGTGESDAHECAKHIQTEVRLFVEKTSRAIAWEETVGQGPGKEAE